MSPGENDPPSDPSAETQISAAPVPTRPGVTTSITPPDTSRTQFTASPTAVQAPAAETLETQQVADRRLAQELSRRGIAPDEVQRLLSLGRADIPQPTKKRGAPALVSPPELPPSEAFVPKPTITLPDFREHSTQERIDADRLLTGANISRRRGLFKQAEKECLEAIQLVPADAAALELLGDILQSVGRVDDATYAYGRAMEADSSRKTAEKKYAELMLAQNREIEILRQEFIPRNPSVAVLLSGVLPGAGQMYNGETIKGLIALGVTLGILAAIFWSPYGLPHSQNGIPNSLVTLLIAFCVVYLYAVIDAKIGASRGKRMKSGWEV